MNSPGSLSETLAGPPPRSLTQVNNGLVDEYLQVDTRPGFDLLF